jgi:hypothetical protein
VDLYTFLGSTGQTVSLALASTGGFSSGGGSTSVQLTVFSPSGTAVGTLRSNSQVSLVLAEAGSYVVRISATNLAATGSYTIRLACV